MTTQLIILLLTISISFIACDSKKVEKTADTSKHKITTDNLFPENSIGVAYLDTAIGDSYSLTIRFPNSNLSDSLSNRDTSNYTKDSNINLPLQTIILFDERGQLITLSNISNCISKFWCENDGGIQYELLTI